MKVKEVMSSSPATCAPDTPLQEVARSMQEHDCGAIPVTENGGSAKVSGIVTDRDIVCRMVAEGTNPLEKTAGDCMSTPCYTVHPDDDLEACEKIMEQHQVRRVAVVDDDDRCCGIVSQADIARRAPEHDIAEVVREVSQATGVPSR